MNKISKNARKFLSMAAMFFLGTSSIIAIVREKGTDEQTRKTAAERLLSDPQIDDSEAVRLIFKEGVNVLPALQSALREGKNVERASRALAYLGGPKERKVLRDAIAAEKDEEKKSLMSSLLAGALVEPASGEEWRFLENCLAGYKDENRTFASFSAALALGVNASPQALRMLQTIIGPGQSASSENDAVEEAAEAIRWIKQRPSSSKANAPVGAQSDSEQFKEIILKDSFFVEKERERFSVEDVVFMRGNSRALVSAEIYRSPTNAQGYDMVLERRQGMWKITGVWLSLVADFGFGGAAPFAFLRVRVLNFSSAVYVLSLNPRLTVSPNFKIPANSF